MNGSVILRTLLGLLALHGSKCLYARQRKRFATTILTEWHLSTVIVEKRKFSVHKIMRAFLQDRKIQEIRES